MTMYHGLANEIPQGTVLGNNKENNDVRLIRRITKLGDYYKSVKILSDFATSDNPAIKGKRTAMEALEVFNLFSSLFYLDM